MNDAALAIDHVTLVIACASLAQGPGGCPGPAGNVLVDVDQLTAAVGQSRLQGGLRFVT